MGFLLLGFIISFLLVKSKNKNRIVRYLEKLLYSTILSLFIAIISTLIGGYINAEKILDRKEKIVNIDNKAFVLDEDGDYLVATMKSDSTYKLYAISKDNMGNYWTSADIDNPELYIYDEELVSVWKYIFFRLSTTYEIKINNNYEQY